MRLYRVEYYSDYDGSSGYSWHTNRREAAREQARWLREADHAHEESRTATITPINLIATRAGILQALKRYASYNNNG